MYIYFTLHLTRLCCHQFDNAVIILAERRNPFSQILTQEMSRQMKKKSKGRDFTFICIQNIPPLFISVLLSPHFSFCFLQCIVLLVDQGFGTSIPRFFRRIFHRSQRRTSKTIFPETNRSFCFFHKRHEVCLGNYMQIC